MFRAIFALPGHTARFAAKFWSGYTGFGQVMLTLAAVAIVVDAVICYNYGVTNTFWHGVGFALLAAVLAVMPDAAYEEWQKKAYGSAVAIAAGCLIMLPVAYQSHLGYSASVRVGDINIVAAKSEVRDNRRGSIEQARKDHAMAEAAIERLKWLPSTVTVDGAEADIKNLEGDRIYARSRQCTNVTLPESRAFCDRLTELRKQKAAAEDLSKERARLDAANAWLNRANERLENTEVAQSAVANQTKVASQLYNLMRGQAASDAINPDTVTLAFVNTGIAGANSLAFLLMAPLCWFVANRYRKQGHGLFSDSLETVASKPANVSREAANVSHGRPSDSFASWTDLHRALNHLTEPKRIAA